MYKKYDNGHRPVDRGASQIAEDCPQVRTATLATLAAAILLSLAGSQTAYAKSPNTPTDGLPSPLYGTLDFSQQMLRFEEFGLYKMEPPGTPAVPKSLPMPPTCDGRPDPAAMDAFLSGYLYPEPTIEANTTLNNPWETIIDACLGEVTPTGGVIEGRPPGINFAHQRWDEFPPQVFFVTAHSGARASTGRHDKHQRHGYVNGEFGPDGLYHNVVGVPGFEASTNGIPIKFSPSMPIQEPNTLWTFGDGTLPPKLLPARYGEPILFRHYNALPVDPAANNGFGEHTITTHEHNGHNPGESDGFAGAYFYPGEFYDYRWPMTLAGYDFINRDATDPRASTPCAPGEVMNIPDPITAGTIAKTCDPVTGTINIAGDYHETMSTHWFHDHMIDRTSQNVYKGNAAMMNYYSGIDTGNESFKCNYDDPANNINLCFPSGTDLGWGNRDYDVQLLLADKAWSPVDGQLYFAPLNEDGFLGDRMTVNWLYKPYLDVRARQYRLRLLNGSVSRFFKIAIVREHNDLSGTFPGPLGSNKSYTRVPFHMVANDGNIMEHAVAFPNAQSFDLPIQSIAERHDVIVDFAQFPAGTKLFMVNTLAHTDGRGPDRVEILADVLSGLLTAIQDTTCIAGDTNCWSEDPTLGKFLEFRVQPYAGTDLSMNPADYEVGKLKMIPLPKITDADIAAATHRTFTFGRGGGVSPTDGTPTPWTITTDGGAALTADVNLVSAAPETMGGGWEIWHIVNGGGGWAHPVHIHFEEGQYLQRAEIDVAGNIVNARLPPVWEQGARKDMYRVSGLGGLGGIPDSSMVIDVAIRFREFAGTFVEHCHNTTHEDKAMLLRWDNENPGQTVRIPTPLPSWDGVGYVASGTVLELLTIKTGDVLAAATFVAPNQLNADINFDGVVNLSDYSILRGQFGRLGNWAADLNESNQTNLSDYSILRADFGRTAGIPLTANNPFPF
jgi:FtsP/CotA-like multicopper oxidase with cupredoxin domain